MRRYRLIAPQWLRDRDSSVRGSLEGHYSDEELTAYNLQGYNIYWFPNDASRALKEVRYLNSTHIDRFKYVFIDIDFKDGVYTNLPQATKKISEFSLPASMVVSSGNGVHAYWKVSDLSKETYVELQLKLIRYFKSDASVYKICQLMRYPNSENTKNPHVRKKVKIISTSKGLYSVDDFNLPELDEIQKAIRDSHLMSEDQKNNLINLSSAELPDKFVRLLEYNEAIKDLFLAKTGDNIDRSSAMWNLMHELIFRQYSKEELLKVALNTEKGKQRGADWIQRHVLAKVLTSNKDGTPKKFIWKTAYDVAKETEIEPETAPMRMSLEALDPFVYGYRRGDVMGLIAGSGGGKTTLCLNFIKEFLKKDKNYIHVYVSLEMPHKEIISRYKQMCQFEPDADELMKQMIVFDNYREEDGAVRDLSFPDIKKLIMQIKNTTDKEVGCVIIDNINILESPKNKGGGEVFQSQSLMANCKYMKEFAVSTNTFLIMQSQSSREKAGNGDMPLYQDAAFGTSKFENYCSYVVTAWQPLKAKYPEMARDPMAPQENFRMLIIRFCKSRFQDPKDKVHVNANVPLRFDLTTNSLFQFTPDDYLFYNKYIDQAIEHNKTKRSERDKDILVIGGTNEPKPIEDGNSDFESAFGNN